MADDPFEIDTFDTFEEESEESEHFCIFLNNDTYTHTRY